MLLLNLSHPLTDAQRGASLKTAMARIARFNNAQLFPLGFAGLVHLSLSHPKNGKRESERLVEESFPGMSDEAEQLFDLAMSFLKKRQVDEDSEK